MIKNEKNPNKYPDLRYESKKYKNKKQKKQAITDTGRK